MLASELIDLLGGLIQEHGDLECVTRDMGTLLKICIKEAQSL